MGGGPSDSQKKAKQIELGNAQQQQDLAKQSAGRFNSLYGTTQPFYQQELNNGLPFMGSLTDYASGNTAQAYAPARASFLRRTATLGGLPSGFRQAGLNDIQDQQAHAFDNQLGQAQLLNYQTRQHGAQGLAGLMQLSDPSRFYGGSTQAAQAGTQPLQNQPTWWSGLLGGAAQGAASALPF